MNAQKAMQVIRFVLEIAALFAMSAWADYRWDGDLEYVLSYGIPMAGAFAWGFFRWPGDPGYIPVAIPGILRLALEGAFFAFALWGLRDAGHTLYGWILAGALLCYSIADIDRGLRMLGLKQSDPAVVEPPDRRSRRRRKPTV